MPSSAVLERPKAFSPTTLEQTPLVDWEAPAAAAECRYRVDLPRFIWREGGDPHWLGQRCDVVKELSAGLMCEVVFACGCHATVASALLSEA
jgi:hypothetical protein